jgi:hypothetical protein
METNPGLPGEFPELGDPAEEECDHHGQGHSSTPLQEMGISHPDAR